MKLNPKKRPFPKKFIIVFAVAALAVGGWVAITFFKSNTSNQQNATSIPLDNRPPNTVDYGPPTDKEKQAGDDIKKNTPAPQDLSITITRAGQLDQTVSVRSFVTGVASGECQATFKKQGQPDIVKDFPMGVDVSSATCNYDISAQEFSQAGDWQLQLIAKQGDYITAPAVWTVNVSR